MNNRPFQVLASTGDQALLAKDKLPSELALGQLGVFDAQTGLSLDASATNIKEAYIALGMNADAILTSTGDYITVKELKANLKQEPVSAVDKIIDVDLTNATVDCQTAYGVKVELRNEAVAKNFGYNQATRTYVTRTGCCEDCSGCGTGDCVQFAVDMVKQINEDNYSEVVTAELVDRTGASPVVVLEADVATWVAANADACLSIRLTFGSTDMFEYCKVNLRYEYPRQTNAIVSFKAECTGVEIVTVQELVYAEGMGYDLAQMEDIAGGWNGNPGIYRQSELVGESIGSFTKTVDKTALYNIYTLSYNHVHDTGMQRFSNPMETYIGVPQTDTTTSAALENVLAAVFA